MQTSLDLRDTCMQRNTSHVHRALSKNFDGQQQQQHPVRPSHGRRMAARRPLLQFKAVHGGWRGQHTCMQWAAGPGALLACWLGGRYLGT